MPGFLFVSGLFSKKTIKDNNIRKILPYLTIYFFIKFSMYLTNVLCIDKFNGKMLLLSCSGVEWFILALFFMNIITMGIKDYKPIYILTTSIILSLFAGYNRSDNDFLAILRIINFYPFFYMGYILKVDKVLEIVNKKYLKIVSIIIFFVLMFVVMLNAEKFYFLRTLLTGRSAYYLLIKHKKFAILFRGLIILLSSIMVFVTMSMMPNRKLLISKLGTKTLTIYAFHMIFITVLFKGLNLQTYMITNIPRIRYLTGALILIGVMITVVSANILFDMFIKKILSNDWKMKDKKKLISD